MTAWDIIANADEKQLEEIKAKVKRRLSGEKFSERYIYKIRTKDGNALWVKAFAATVFYNGEWVGFIMVSDITHEISQKESFKELSEHDALTGINNRRYFDYKLAELLNIALRYKRPLSLIMFDIDHFKDINDAYGHGTGDFILKELSAVTKEELRTTDFFARYGGEEFMIIAPETPLSTVKELAERLRLKVEKHDFKIGQTVTCSFGVTEVKTGDTSQSIIYRADTALYEAKETGRNKVCY
jgi:two-component system cell cycle response regulator